MVPRKKKKFGVGISDLRGGYIMHEKFLTVKKSVGWVIYTVGPLGVVWEKKIFDGKKGMTCALFN